MALFSDLHVLEKKQLAQLRRLFSSILPSNKFYQEKYSGLDLNAALQSLDAFKEVIPITSKAEVVVDQQMHPPYGRILTWPLPAYSRYSQTSGTSGQPLRWLDTAESWEWMLHAWRRIFDACGLKKGDRLGFAFSFGPFLGFWTAFDAAVSLGYLAIPAGGLSSVARLKMFRDNRIDALLCTPTYAIRLGEVARSEGIDFTDSPVKAVIVAGEPGGSLPATVRQIERLWPGCHVYDHHGMTETGPVSYECPDNSDILRIMGDNYLAEVVEPETLQPITPGTPGELVLTTLGRTGSPLIRYRTGDLVCEATDAAGNNAEMALAGGILGRTDDMYSIRGVNIYPAAIDAIVRTFNWIAEYQVVISKSKGMHEMAIVVEPFPDHQGPPALLQALETELTVRLALRIPVRGAASGELPRFEMTAKRRPEAD